MDPIYDAQQCYKLAMENEKIPFDASKNLKGKDMVRRSKTGKIEYTSPLYLANIMLCRIESEQPEKNRPQQQLEFKVLEKDNEMDEIACDSLESRNSDVSDADNPRLQEIREKQKLHEKAEHLLGRSYRNAVFHQSKNSLNSSILSLSHRSVEGGHKAGQQIGMAIESFGPDDMNSYRSNNSANSD
jgi:hypothetical protein